MNKHLGAEILTGEAARQAFDADEEEPSEVIICDFCDGPIYDPDHDNERWLIRGGFEWICDRCLSLGIGSKGWIE